MSNVSKKMPRFSAYDIRIRSVTCILTVVGFYVCANVLLLGVRLPRKPMQFARSQNYLNHTPEAHDHVTKVLIVAYFRGGSSFFGDTFNHDPEAFYWFEPLHFEQMRLKKSRTLRAGVYIKDNTTGLLWPLPDHYIRVTTGLIKSILNCDIRSLSVDVLRDQLVWQKSEGFLKMLPCIRELAPKPISLKNITDEAILECLPLAENSCLRSKIRVIKTIRIRLDTLSDIREQVPDLKTIYLTRDPRGRQWSQMHLPTGRQLRRYNLTLVERGMYSWRTRFLDDARWLQENINNPAQVENWVLWLKYEGFARDTTKSLAEIYQFVGRPLPAEVVDWARQSTGAEKDGAVLETSRKNSTWTATRWRSEMPPDLRAMLDRVFEYVLLRMGYEL